MDLRQIKVEAGRVRPDDVRPGVHEHGRVPEPRSRYIDGDKGILLLPRLPDRAAGRAQHLPRDGLPGPVRRAARPGAARRSGPTDVGSHTMRATRHREDDRRLPPRCAPDGHVPQHGRRARRPSIPTPRTSATPRSRRLQTHPADRQGADASRPTRCRHTIEPAARPARQRAELHRQLPEHAVQDDRARSTSRTRCSSGRSKCCSSCTPTTSRTAARTRCAASAARRPIRTRRWPARRRRSTARSTAAPTRPCCGC